MCLLDLGNHVNVAVDTIRQAIVWVDELDAHGDAFPVDGGVPHLTGNRLNPLDAHEGELKLHFIDEPDLPGLQCGWKPDDEPAAPAADVDEGSLDSTLIQKSGGRNKTTYTAAFTDVYVLDHIGIADEEKSVGGVDVVDDGC